MNPKVRDVLIKARDVLIKDDGGWTQHAEARDKNGYKVNFKSPFAVRFCIMGALMRACDEESYHGEDVFTEVAERIVMLTTPPQTISEWNDESIRTYKDIVKLFDSLTK